MKKLLIPLSIVACLLFGTETYSQTNIEITIQFPYQGYNNEWTITYRNRNNSSETYQFVTTNQQYPWGVPGQSGVLGVVPEGTYDVEFDSNYSPDYFDYFMADDYTPGPHYKIVYNVPVDATNNYIIIDKF